MINGDRRNHTEIQSSLAFDIWIWRIRIRRLQSITILIVNWQPYSPIWQLCPPPSPAISKSYLETIVFLAFDNVSP